MIYKSEFFRDKKKRYITAGVFTLLVVVILVGILLWQKKNYSAPKIEKPKSEEEKRQELIEIIDKVNKAERGEELTPKKEIEKREDLTKAIDKVNKENPKENSISEEEEIKRMQELLKVINENNSK